MRYTDHYKLTRMGLGGDAGRFQREKVIVIPAFFVDYPRLRIFDHNRSRLPRQKYQNLFPMAIKTLTTIFRLADNQVSSFLYILGVTADGYFKKGSKNPAFSYKEA
jgi:hypothetical protein